MRLYRVATVTDCDSHLRHGGPDYRPNGATRGEGDKRERKTERKRQRVKARETEREREGWRERERGCWSCGVNGGAAHAIQAFPGLELVGGAGFCMHSITRLATN